MSPAVHRQRAARFRRAAAARARSQNTNAEPNGFARAISPHESRHGSRPPRIPLAPMRVFGLELQSRAKRWRCTRQALAAIARGDFASQISAVGRSREVASTRTNAPPPADRRLTLLARRCAVHCRLQLLRGTNDKPARGGEARCLRISKWMLCERRSTKLLLHKDSAATQHCELLERRDRVVE